MSAGPVTDTAAGPAPAPALELRAGALRLALRPDLGAAIAGLWCGALPVLHSTAPAALAGARPSGGFVMAPYSNRLGFCRFRWAGEDHRTAPNTTGSPHSMHGLAWARPWAVLASSAGAAELELRHAGDADWPFAFVLRQRLTLMPGALKIDLVFVNTDARAQPVGLGWHPFFARRPGSRLRIGVAERWEPDPATALPSHPVPQAGIDAAVADLAFDHCFTGWTGVAAIDDEALSLRLSAPLSRLVVFTPADKPYFCVEPVSHVNNALQRADPAAHGVRSLAPGALMDLSFLLEITPRPTP